MIYKDTNVVSKEICNKELYFCQGRSYLIPIYMYRCMHTQLYISIYRASTDKWTIYIFCLKEIVFFFCFFFFVSFLI